MNARRVKTHFLYAVIVVSFWFFFGWPAMAPAASEPDTPLPRYLSDQWNRENGFPFNHVRAVTQTPDGFLWIATENQLLRFDGVTFENISAETGQELINDSLFDLRVDKSGTLLIGSIWGLVAYEPKTGGLKEIPLIGQGNGPIPVTRLLEDKTGSLWIGTQFNYLYRISGGENVLYDAVKGLPCRAVSALCETGTGGIRVGAPCGLFRLQNDSFHGVPLEIPGDESDDDIPVTALHEDGDGFLWIGTNGGLLRVGDNNGPPDRYTTAEGLADNRVTEILESENGTLWVGTADGLNRIKKGPGENIPVGKYLEGFYITSLYEDRDDSLWIGTRSSGIKRLREVPFSIYSKKVGVPPRISSMYTDGKGNTWMGTAIYGLFRYRGGVTAQFLTEAEIFGSRDDDNLGPMAEDAEGNLWVGAARGGLIKIGIEDKAIARYSVKTHDGLVDDNIRTLYRDDRGYLWVGTDRGICRYKAGMFETPPPRHKLSAVSANGFCEDGLHNLWTAAEKGLYVLEEGEWDEIREYLEGVEVISLYRCPADPPGVIWICTNGGGLKRFKDSVFTSFTAKDGLDSNGIFQVLEDDRGYFWLRTGAGIIRAAKKELDDLADGNIDHIHWLLLGKIYGARNRLYQEAVRAANGEFWFTGGGEITAIHPEKTILKEIVPRFPAAIEKVAVHRGNGEWTTYAVTVTVPAQEPVYKDIEGLSIYFTVPAFIGREKIRFRYKLDGYDHRWIEHTPGTERRAVYTGLRPGDYTFKVTAGMTGGTGENQEAVFTFRVSQAFHKNAVFRAVILVLFLASFTVGILLLKERVLMRVEKYKGSTLDAQQTEKILKRLDTLLEVEKVYRDVGISPASLSEKLSIHPDHLAQIIGEILNKNFAEFINGYRIEEAKKRILEEGGKTILEISQDVGFKSKAAFYRAFKKYTGTSPSEFRKNNNE